MKVASLAHLVWLGAAVCLPAMAQAQQPMQPMRSAMPARMAQNVEQRLAKLHDALGITPAEESLWQQFAQVTRSNTQDMSRVFATRTATLNTMSASDNLQSMADAAAVHARNMQRLVAAFQPLYAAMPPQQQQMADSAFRTPGTRPRH